MVFFLISHQYKSVAELGEMFSLKYFYFCSDWNVLHEKKMRTSLLSSSVPGGMWSQGERDWIKLIVFFASQALVEA